MEKFDGLLYGNGLTLNLLAQLKPLIDLEKQYLLNIDTFLKAFISKKLNIKEERRLFGIFYSSKKWENLKNFEKIRTLFGEFYEKHDANIEYWFGVYLFHGEKDRNHTIFSLFPCIYSIWHEILIDYFSYLGLKRNINNFENSVLSVLKNNPIVLTTNFDRFTDGLLPQHLHGIFIPNLRKYNDIVLSMVNEKIFYFKHLWGHNGIGKQNFIDKIKDIPGHDKYFNFNFFYNEEICIKRLLIYGLGFQKSGYVKELSMNMPQYKTPFIGGIVDEHILLRLDKLQKKGQLCSITFAYYSDADLKYYKDLITYFGLKDINYLKSCEFLLSIK